jgi:hypothetical protein
MDAKKYEKSVDEIADLKKDQYSRRSVFKALKNIFEKAFDREPKEFELVSNMVFWKQGYPTPDNVAKLAKLLDKFSTLVHWYSFMRNNEIKKYLQAKGITIGCSPQISSKQLTAANFDTQDWDEAFGAKIDFPDTLDELIEMLVSRRNEEFEQVVESKELVKEKAKATETDSTVKAAHVKKAAQLRMKQLLQKDIKKDLQKVEQNIASASTSIIIFDKK